MMRPLLSKLLESILYIFPELFFRTENIILVQEDASSKLECKILYNIANGDKLFNICLSAANDMCSVCVPIKKAYRIRRDIEDIINFLSFELSENDQQKHPRGRLSFPARLLENSTPLKGAEVVKLCEIRGSHLSGSEQTDYLVCALVRLANLSPSVFLFHVGRSNVIIHSMRVSVGALRPMVNFMRSF